MNRHAFTLVELLVVIAIIGLLSTVAVVAMAGSRIKARETKRMADVRQIITAMQMYLDANGHYPDTGALGCAGGGSTSFCLGRGDSGTCWGSFGVHGCTALDNALAPYMGKIPSDPKNDSSPCGDAYIYQYSGAISLGNDTPGVHWGTEQTSASASQYCLSGYSGQWGATCLNRYYCTLKLP